MIFYNAIFIPLLFVSVTIICQIFLDKDTFTEIYKSFGSGLIAGLPIILIINTTQNLFPQTILAIPVFFKFFLINGVLFWLLTGSLYKISTLITIKGTEGQSLFHAGLTSGAFISGVLTIYNIFQSINGNFYDSILEYISYGSLIIAIAFCFGFIYQKIEEQFSTIFKLLLMSCGVISLSLICSLFYFLTFYNSKYYVIFVLPALAIIILIYLKRDEL